MRANNQRCDLGRDLDRERGFEAPFFAVSFEPGPSVCLNSASHKRSLAATTSWANTRKRWHSAICCRVRSTASRGMIFVTVLPFTAWVSEKLGPWPRSPARAHRQLGLPHRRYRATSEPGRISPTAAKSARNWSRRWRSFGIDSSRTDIQGLLTDSFYNCQNYSLSSPSFQAFPNTTTFLTCALSTSQGYYFVCDDIQCVCAIHGINMGADFLLPGRLILVAMHCVLKSRPESIDCLKPLSASPFPNPTFTRSPVR